MNQAVSFGLLGVGGVAVIKALTGSSFADVVKGHPGAVPSSGSQLATVAGAGSAVAAAGAAAVNTATGATTGLSGSLTQVVDEIAKTKGWGPSEVADWLAVISKESGGSLTAQNPTSSAYGIAQFIDGASEYAKYGGDSTTVSGQLTAMANYITQRYGSPTAAWAHEQSFGWY